MHACMHTYIHTYVRTYIRTYVHTYMHTIFSHTFLLCHTPSFTFHFVTHNCFNFSISHRLISLSFPVPATTFDAHYWKKLTCGVIRSFNLHERSPCGLETHSSWPLWQRPEMVAEGMEGIHDAQNWMCSIEQGTRGRPHVEPPPSGGASNHPRANNDGGLGDRWDRSCKCTCGCCGCCGCYQCYGVYAAVIPRCCPSKFKTQEEQRCEEGVEPSLCHPGQKGGRTMDRPWGPHAGHHRCSENLDGWQSCQSHSTCAVAQVNLHPSSWPQCGLVKDQF